MTAFALEVRDGRTELPVRVQPGAARARVAGVFDGRLKIAVTAPPDKGRANDELVEFVAHVLGLRASSVALVAGPRSRDKRLSIAAPPEVVRAALLAELG
jgi:uncharacterized protein (TIGR00251 family)